MVSTDEARAARGAGKAHATVTDRADVAAGLRPVARVRQSVLARARALFAWWQTTRAARTQARFSSAGGGVLTGGIAYAALFSVFAGLTLGYTVFMSVLGRNVDLRDDVLATVAGTFPGLLDTGTGDGLIEPDDLVLSAGLSVAGVVAVVVLLVSATTAVAAMRTAVRAMFDALGENQGNIVTGKLRELVGFAGMAFAVLLSAVLSVAVTTAADWLLGVVGLEDSSAVVVRVLGIGVAFVVDAATFLLLVYVLAGQRPDWVDLRGGALIAATGIGVVRLLGTSVVAGSVGRNALFASFTVVVTLLVWINLIARIVLLAAAWTADPPLPEAAPDCPEEPASGSEGAPAAASPQRDAAAAAATAARR